jgi:peptidylprolyl isomerase
MLRLLLCCLAAAAILAGCGSDDSGSPSTSASTSADTTAATTTTRTASDVIKNPFEKPKYPPAHPGEKVESLMVTDVKKGTGPALKIGDTGIFDFIATNWRTGKPLEDSWGKKRAFETVIDAGVVIEGWAQGIPGMRVGGRRQLLIPPSLGFATNVDKVLRVSPVYFDVVLLGIKPATATAR